jgi:tRNA dimethylallyltransferase
MEVFTSTKVPLSEWQNQKSAVGPYHFINFSIMPNERKELHERIAIRFKAMLKAGLIDEVQMLLKKYRLHHDMPSMRCVGYRQTLAFLDGKYSAGEFQERGIIATRQLAKRQITWLRAWKDLYPLDTHSSNNLGIVLQKVSAITG